MHETTHGGLYGDIEYAIRQMGLRQHWRPTHASTLSSNRDGSSREGDSGGGPLPERTSADSWPTLVVEVGVSQTLRDLQTTIRWWFYASNHEVKIVLLVKIYRQQQQIVLEKWTEGVSSTPRQGATTTRSAATIAPLRRQEITIDMLPAASAATPGDPIRADPASYVASDALRLEFELLFLRRPNTGEHDVVLTEEMFRVLAAQIWSL